jgi:hypothetical protein
VTMDEVLHDLYVRKFATDTALFGRLDTYDIPDRIDFRNEVALEQWRDGRLAWNTEFTPGFYRDIWPILYRPDQFRFLCDILAQSNFPHDQEQRGLFNPDYLSVVPGSARAREIAAAHGETEGRPPPKVEFASLARLAPKTVRGGGREPPGEPGQGPGSGHRSTEGVPREEPADPYGPLRRFLFGLLRMPGEENEFKIQDRVSSRLHNLPLMPLLCGDNPLTNVVPSKFLRLTEYQLFILKQWADGRFVDEINEGWLKRPPYTPFLPYPTTPPRTGRELDRGVLAGVLGGAFCPGGEATWIMRNPSIYWEPYRFKADRTLSGFLLTAAQENTGTGIDQDYTFNVGNALSQDSDFAAGLQPGDVTKYSALPWQVDFNECTTNVNDVTYADWNLLYPESENDERLEKNRKQWETMWWPAHRPLQYMEVVSVSGTNASYLWTNWTKGVPQTNQGDLKMVTEWARLGFIIRNPYLAPDLYDQAATGNDPIYVSIEPQQR